MNFLENNVYGVITVLFYISICLVCGGILHAGYFDNMLIRVLLLIGGLVAWLKASRRAHWMLEDWYEDE